MEHKIIETALVYAINELKNVKMEKVANDIKIELEKLKFGNLYFNEYLEEQDKYDYKINMIEKDIEMLKYIYCFGLKFLCNKYYKGE